jgi:hypothetical protein
MASQKEAGKGMIWRREVMPQVGVGKLVATPFHMCDDASTS